MNFRMISTQFAGEQIVSEEVSGSFQPDTGIEMQAVNLYPQKIYQVFEGFGGALTEAAGYTFSHMSKEKQQDVLEAYFGAHGNRYRYARLHLDSCDFSLGHYAACEDPEDVQLRTFSLQRDEKYILPLLRAAEQTAGQHLSLVLSPWSPPAFMKTNGERNHGGELKPEYRERWAEYVCRYLTEYRQKGFQVSMLTVQNEPNATQIWDSCRYTPAQEKEWIRDYLYPAMQKHQLQDVGIYIWDHNKERAYERACAILDDDTASMVEGIAFHWYTGDHFDALRLIREDFPDKKLVFTEGCVEYSRFQAENQLANAQMYAHDILGNINAGMNIWIDWNILLDGRGGPNHVGNFCDAPILYDIQTQLLTKNLSYTYIGHFSRYIQPGARRIGVTSYTDHLEVTALQNPDQSLTAVFLNRTQREIPAVIRLQGEYARILVAPQSIATVILEN